MYRILYIKHPCNNGWLLAKAQRCILAKMYLKLLWHYPDPLAQGLFSMLNSVCRIKSENSPESPNNSLTLWRIFMVDHHLCPVQNSLLPGSADFPIHSAKGKMPICLKLAIYVDRIGHLSIAVCKLVSYTKLEIIQINILLVIVEIIIRFSGRGLFHREMSRITGVSQIDDINV